MALKALVTERDGLKAYFEKKMREGKHYVSALNAVERKLLHIIDAV